MDFSFLESHAKVEPIIFHCIYMYFCSIEVLFLVLQQEIIIKIYII